jgi:hypothetical protein
LSTAAFGAWRIEDKWRNQFFRTYQNEMLEKIIAIIIGAAAVAVFAWKFKGTPLCLP